MTPRRAFCLLLAHWLCTLPLSAQNLALRGSLALTGCTAVDAVGGTAYAASQWDVCRGQRARS